MQKFTDEISSFDNIQTVHVRLLPFPSKQLNVLTYAFPCFDLEIQEKALVTCSLACLPLCACLRA